MINKDFIAGIAIGALQTSESNIDFEKGGYRWNKYDGNGSLGLIIYYKCAHSLTTLNKAAMVVRSFCSCPEVVVGVGSVKFVIEDDNEEGGEG